MLATGILPALLFTLQTSLDEAKQLQQQGNLPQAIALVEPIVTSEPENLEAGALLAWLYTNTGRTDDAISEYRRLSERFPDHGDLHNSLGALLFREGRPDEARTAFEQARALAPHVAMPHFNLGLLSFQRGELQAAIDSFAHAIEIEPERPMYHLSLGRAHRASFQFEPAADAFRKALALSPPPPLARLTRLELALTLKHLGLLHASEDVLTTLLASDASDPDALFQMGRLHVAMNQYPEAAVEFSRLVEARPEDVPARFMLGLVRYRSDDLDGALAAFEALLALSPDHAEGGFYAGMILRKQGRDAESRAAFERALESDPNHVAANYNLALLLAKLGEREASRERLERFRTLSARRERLEFLEERVRLNPTQASYYFELGQEYTRHRRKRDALSSFQRALELDPNLAAAEVAITDLLRSP